MVMIGLGSRFKQKACSALLDRRLLGKNRMRAFSIQYNTIQYNMSLTPGFLIRSITSTRNHRQGRSRLQARLSVVECMQESFAEAIIVWGCRLYLAEGVTRSSEAKRALVDQSLWPWCLEWYPCPCRASLINQLEASVIFPGGWRLSTAGCGPRW